MMIFFDLSIEAAGNKCRNPNGEKDMPFCYTTNPDITWEYCFGTIPACESRDHVCKYTKVRSKPKDESLTEGSDLPWCYDLDVAARDAALSQNPSGQIGNSCARPNTVVMHIIALCIISLQFLFA